MFYIASAIHVIFNAFMLFSPSYVVVLVLRFLAGLSFQTNFQMPYIIGKEMFQKLQDDLIGHLIAKVF